MLELFCCPLNRVDVAVQQLALTRLSADERVRLSAFRREEARVAFLAGRALLREVLAERTGRAPAELSIVLDANDKPQLAGGDWHFNLSHCHGWVALAVSAQAPVGVDIEHCQRSNNIMGIAQRFFAAAECAVLKTLDEPGRSVHFCELWALKEAWVKWCGLGIGRALAGVGVQIERGRIDWQLRADLLAGVGLAIGAETLQALLFAPATDVRLAVVTGALQEVAVSLRVPGAAASTLALQPLAQTSAV